MKSATSLWEKGTQLADCWKDGGLIKFQNKWKQKNMKFSRNIKSKIIAWKESLKPLFLRS
jgi:hypothetical protein